MIRSTLEFKTILKLNLMRMKLQRLFIILACFLVYPNIAGSPVIRLSMRSLPDPEHMLNSIKKAGKIDHYQWQAIIDHPPYQGIISTYAGFMGTSDYNGQTLFPLKHKESSFYILVTENIIPIAMFANTIHHWELLPGAPAHMFKCEIKKDKGNLYFWHIDPVPVPSDHIIPLHTIIIMANPDYIVVPTGILASSNNPNIIIPDIYVKKGINVIKNANYILNIRHLFANVALQYNKQPTRYEIEVNQ